MTSAADEGTKKLYLDDFTCITAQAIVLQVIEGDRGLELVLDQTCFYPGGGGQPCDTGTISWTGGELAVEKVYKDQDGVVYHSGAVSGSQPKVQSSVGCQVDQLKRAYHSRLHSAGHLLDLAVSKAGYAWEPGRGAHFPDTSFVEYSGAFNGEQAEEYKTAIQREINAIIAAGGSVTISQVSPDEARARSDYIPEAILQKYDLIHLATYNESFDICCGGTHVSTISDIGVVNVTKVKKKDGVIRVSYSIEPKN